MTESISSKLSELNNKRGSAKRFVTILNNIIDKEPNNTCIILNSIKNANRAVAVFFEAITENYEAAFDDEFTKYFEVCTELDNKLATLKQVYAPEPTRAVEHANSGMNLPTIVLPKFSGKITEWASFKSRFDTLVGCRDNLSEIDKLQYLLSSLSDAALDVVRGLEITPGSYSIAIKSLTERFDNVRVTVYGHVKTICHIPPIHKESHDSIRDLLDTLVQSHRSLQNLKRPVEHCDDFIIQIIYEKLPHSLQREWDALINNTDFPTFEQLRSFLVKKCQQLETNPSRMRDNPSKPGLKSLACVKPDASKKETKCAVCLSPHFTRLCPELLKLNPSERVALIISKRVCLNCFGVGHFSKNCRKSRCMICNNRHNTVLHVDRTPTTSPDEANVSVPSTLCNVISKPATPIQTVLLTTCIVGIKDHLGRIHSARALLDSGSQVNVITSELANRLNLNRHFSKLAIQGVGGKQVGANQVIRSEISSLNEKFSSSLDFYVLEHITDRVPTKSVNVSMLNIPASITLADPGYHVSSEIDLLIGAQLFWRTLKPNRIIINPNLLLQESVFGWLINGSVDADTAPLHSRCYLLNLTHLDKSISKFWEIEHLNDPVISVEDKVAENHFVNNTYRNKDGRFVVALPFRDPPDSLGNSLMGCTRRYLNLENKLNRDPLLKSKYNDFISEYIELGHMSRLCDISQAKDSDYYIPHHAVLKGGDVSKIRVVFDASFKTSNGVSLNDIMLKGPVIQDNLFALLIRFRCHKWVMTVDICKMYRQFLIQEPDRRYQNILYRFDDNQTISVYQLNTVTYGTKPASFLATRCLKALGESVTASDIELARVVCKDFYMDDALTGGKSEDELISLRDRLIKLFSTAGLKLSKWCTNSVKFAESIPNADLVVEKTISTSEEDLPKVLGIYWSNYGDQLKYKYDLPPENVCTKRLMLSAISRLFDPLGIIGPVIVRAKLFMQKLWKANCSWDEPLPPELLLEWSHMIRDWSAIDKVAISRCITSEDCLYELRGFCDASEKAYGCCIYLVSHHNSYSSSSIICAKSRVSPLKTITLPRLELCAAVLLADVMKVISDALSLKISKTYYFSDSLVALAWIHSCPSRWKTFVAHRVSHIVNLSNPEDWKFIPGRLNPADLISRGCSVSTLVDSESWWNGPVLSQDLLNDSCQIPEELPETRVLVSIPQPIENSFIENFSNFEKLIRTTAWCLRFFNNCRLKDRPSETLSVPELRRAETSLIKFIQGRVFELEIKELSHGRNLPNDSSLLSLNPFIDAEGVLRVGGRISLSNLHDFQKHPVVLPKGHFTKLVIRSVHTLNGHVGAETTLALVRNRFWIINGRNVVRNVLRQCVTCFRANPHFTNPMMGDLPSQRVRPSRAFTNIGIDFFGPFHVKDYVRSKRIYKVYGCVFICLSTKAVHCEVVDSLSTDSFLAALGRFSCRRGLPSCIFTDNATNFVGARRLLNEAHNFLLNNLSDLKVEVSRLRIDWKFIPPRAPHFGGIWEAAVKSFKTILNKKTSSANLTFIELQNILIEAEAILNSRPLCSLSSDPNDLQFLTPGHFIALTDLRSVPVANYDESKEVLGLRWRRVQRLQQELWNTWSREYLTQLQRRSKWQKSKGKPVSVGDLVLLHEDNVPSRLWHLGRITEVHPGKDGVIRFATIKNASGALFRRPTIKLSVLPIDDLGNDCGHFKAGTMFARYLALPDF